MENGGHFQVQKELFKIPAFFKLDYGSQWLYVFMLDRAKLSQINKEKFTDEDGKLFIIYTIEQVMEDMRFTPNRCYYDEKIRKC